MSREPIKKLVLHRETIRVAFRTGLRAGLVYDPPPTPHGHQMYSANGGEETMGHGASGIVQSPDAPPSADAAGAASSGGAPLLSLSR